MCRKEWEKIKFSAVPSVAMKIYRKAFQRHQPERFAEYLEKVKKGEEKINTSVLSPVDIVHQYGCPYPGGFDETLEALWANLKDVVPPEIKFLPIPDVSGSMAGTPIEVAVSLGIYLAQRNKSAFKNGLITFSDNPTFHFLTGKTLMDNISQVSRMNWGGNTNLQGVFQLILHTAVNNKLSVEDMPTHLMIISDMQFNQCISRTGRTGRYGSGVYGAFQPTDDTALEMIDKMYQEAGYTRPNIFFWNVRTSSGVPAKMDDNGVGLISGYSPNLLKSVLSGDLNPLSQVLAVLNDSRYRIVDEIL
jgi:hypothetical protein